MDLFLFIKYTPSSSDMCLGSLTFNLLLAFCEMEREIIYIYIYISRSHDYDNLAFCEMEKEIIYQHILSHDYDNTSLNVLVILEYVVVLTFVHV